MSYGEGGAGAVGYEGYWDENEEGEMEEYGLTVE